MHVVIRKLTSKIITFSQNKSSNRKSRKNQSNSSQRSLDRLNSSKPRDSIPLQKLKYNTRFRRVLGGSKKRTRGSHVSKTSLSLVRAGDLNFRSNQEANKASLQIDKNIKIIEDDNVKTGNEVNPKQMSLAVCIDTSQPVERGNSQDQGKHASKKAEFETSLQNSTNFQGPEMIPASTLNIPRESETVTESHPQRASPEKILTPPANENVQTHNIPKTIQNEIIKMTITKSQNEIQSLATSTEQFKATLSKEIPKQSPGIKLEELVKQDPKQVEPRRQKAPRASSNPRASPESMKSRLERLVRKDGYLKKDKKGRYLKKGNVHDHGNASRTKMNSHTQNHISTQTHQTLINQTCHTSNLDNCRNADLEIWNRGRAANGDGLKGRGVNTSHMPSIKTPTQNQQNRGSSVSMVQYNAKQRKNRSQNPKKNNYSRSKKRVGGHKGSAKGCSNGKAKRSHQQEREEKQQEEAPKTLPVSTHTNIEKEDIGIKMKDQDSLQQTKTDLSHVQAIERSNTNPNPSNTDHTQQNQETKPNAPNLQSNTVNTNHSTSLRNSVQQLSLSLQDNVQETRIPNQTLNVSNLTEQKLEENEKQPCRKTSENWQNNEEFETSNKDDQLGLGENTSKLRQEIFKDKHNRVDEEEQFEEDIAKPAALRKGTDSQETKKNWNPSKTRCSGSTKKSKPFKQVRKLQTQNKRKNHRTKADRNGRESLKDLISELEIDRDNREQEAVEGYRVSNLISGPTSFSNLEHSPFIVNPASISYIKHLPVEHPFTSLSLKSEVLGKEQQSPDQKEIKPESAQKNLSNDQISENMQSTDQNSSKMMNYKSHHKMSVMLDKNSIQGNEFVIEREPEELEQLRTPEFGLSDFETHKTHNKDNFETKKPRNKGKRIDAGRIEMLIQRDTYEDSFGNNDDFFTKERQSEVKEKPDPTQDQHLTKGKFSDSKAKAFLFVNQRSTDQEHIGGSQSQHSDFVNGRGQGAGNVKSHEEYGSESVEFDKEQESLLRIDWQERRVKTDQKHDHKVDFQDLRRQAKLIGHSGKEVEVWDGGQDYYSGKQDFIDFKSSKKSFKRQMMFYSFVRSPVKPKVAFHIL